MSPVISTRILAPSLRNSIREAGIALTEYEAISIRLLPPVEIPDADHYLFSSKNAVKAVKDQVATLAGNVHCVGRKTRALLESYGAKVRYSADDAEALTAKLLEAGLRGRFLHLCGNLRLGTLSDRLRAGDREWNEVIVYETKITAQKIDTPYQGVLFFSPSGVESFTQANELASATAICIGPTTASAAARHTAHITIADHPSQEAVVQRLLEIHRK